MRKKPKSDQTDGDHLAAAAGENCCLAQVLAAPPQIGPQHPAAVERIAGEEIEHREQEICQRKEEKQIAQDLATAIRNSARGVSGSCTKRVSPPNGCSTISTTSSFSSRAIAAWASSWMRIETKKISVAAAARPMLAAQFPT